MVQQFTSDGNIRSRVRKASPIGLRHNTTCRFVLARSMKNAYTSLGDPVLMPAACATPKNTSACSQMCSSRKDGNMTQTCRHKRLSPYDFLPGPDSYGSTCSAGSLAEADPATTPPHLGRLSQGLVYGHHLFIVEKTRNLARVENPVDVLQKGLVDELRIIQQEYRGPDGGCS